MYDNEQTKNEYRGRGDGSVSPDGSYRYVRPESREMLYRDAQIEPCEDAARMPLPCGKRRPRYRPLWIRIPTKP